MQIIIKHQNGAVCGCTVHFFNGRPPPPLHLQSMVGRKGLFCGYKSQRTKGHRGTAGKKNRGLQERKTREKEEQNRGTQKNQRRKKRQGKDQGRGKRAESLGETGHKEQIKEKKA